MELLCYFGEVGVLNYGLWVVGYGLGMNCLISLLWQFEVPSVPIPVTILKNYRDVPNHYFYSSKQNRVLRKKNPNAISTL